MISTPCQKEMLANRRESRDMRRAGYEWVGEGGGKLWEIYRGGRTAHRIIDAKVARSGMGVWVKIEVRC